LCDSCSSQGFRKEALAREFVLFGIAVRDFIDNVAAREWEAACDADLAELRHLDDELEVDRAMWRFAWR
jgi:hypothetical protein